MSIPSEGSPTEPQEEEPRTGPRRHLRGTGAFRPVNSWVAVVLTVVLVVVILLLFR